MGNVNELFASSSLASTTTSKTSSPRKAQMVFGGNQQPKTKSIALMPKEPAKKKEIAKSSAKLTGNLAKNQNKLGALLAARKEIPKFVQEAMNKASHEGGGGAKTAEAKVAKAPVAKKVGASADIRGSKKLSGNLAKNQNKLGALLAGRKGPPPAFARGGSDKNFGTTGKAPAPANKKPVKEPAANPATRKSVQFDVPAKGGDNK